MRRRTKGIGACLVIVMMLATAIGGGIMAGTDAASWSNLTFTSDPVKDGVKQEALGKVNFYVCEEDLEEGGFTEYTKYTSFGINLAEALKNSGLLEAVDSTMDSEYKATVPTESGLHFTGVNMNWGTITKNPDSITENEDGHQWYLTSARQA